MTVIRRASVIQSLLNSPLIRPTLTSLFIITIITLLTGCSSFKNKDTDTANAPLPETNHEPASQQLLEPELKPMAPGQNELGGYDNIWDRIRNGYALPTMSNDQIDKQLRWYSNNQKHVNHVTTSCIPYLHFVVSELEANGLPLELALLPIIESSYDPTVTSSSKAAGIWQFIPQTGKSFGLKKNNWYDGRRDVVASTHAAIRYLKRLHTLFDGDWLLAIAAYNAGEGSVARAMSKNKREGKPTDFWSLPLSNQTKSYVPHLLALSKVIANPAEYDLNINAISNDPYFVKVNVASQINLAQAAKLSNIDAGELKKLNSGFSGWLTHPTEACPLLVPIADATVFTQQLESMPKLNIKQWQEHIVKKGDTLGRIAKHYGVSTSTITSINTLKNSTLRIGQHIQIPLSMPVTDSDMIEADELLAARKQEKASGKTTYYTVKPSDTLWNIAKTQNISRATLEQLNNLSSTSRIKPGQKLLVLNPVTPEKNDAGISSGTRKITYTIQAGDTLTKIASRFNVSKKELLEWNEVRDEGYIHPNQELIIMIPAKG